MENANLIDKKDRILIYVLAYMLLVGQSFSVVCAGQPPLPDESAVNRVLSLDGEGDYVRIADSQSLSSFSEAITIEVWFKAASFYADNGAVNCLIRKNITPERENFFLRFRNVAGKPSVEMSIGYDIVVLKVPYDFAVGTWYHLAGTYDGSSMTVLANGLSIKSEKASGSLYIDKSDLFIGRGDPEFSFGEYFHGALDEFRIWNIARSPEEIRAAMNSPLTGKEEGLVVNLNFDEGTVKDLSGHGNDGLLNADAQIVESPYPVSQTAVAEPQARARPVTGAGARGGIEGDWQIISDQVSQKAVIEIRRESDGTLSGVIVAESAEAPAIPLSNVTFENGKLHFKMPSDQGAFEGTMKEDGLTIEGQFQQQGKMMALVLKRVDAVPSEAAPASQEHSQDRVSGKSNIAIALILVLALAGVFAGIVFFLVRSSIRR